MKRPIILEGPDGIGKSSLARLLSPDVGHLHRDDVVGFDTVTDAINWFYSHARDHEVWDRYHLGSVVYGRRLRLHGTPIQSVMDELNLLSTMNGVAYTVVLFSSDESWYRSHMTALAAQRDELFDVEQMIKVNRAFASLPRLAFDRFVDVSDGRWNKMPSPGQMKREAGW